MEEVIVATKITCKRLVADANASIIATDQTCKRLVAVADGSIKLAKVAFDAKSMNIIKKSSAKSNQITNKAAKIS